MLELMISFVTHNDMSNTTQLVTDVGDMTVGKKYDSLSEAKSDVRILKYCAHKNVQFVCRPKEYTFINVECARGFFE